MSDEYKTPEIIEYVPTDYGRLAVIRIPTDKTYLVLAIRLPDKHIATKALAIIIKGKIEERLYQYEKMGDSRKIEDLERIAADIALEINHEGYGVRK